MDNVKDLRSTSPNSQSVSLNAFNNSSNINIDAVHGQNNSSSVDETNNDKYQTIKISNNVRKRVRVNSTTNDDNRVEIDPNQFVKRNKPVAKDPKKEMRDHAISDLDAAVRRKKQEFQNFVENATIADSINREKIESGLETVNGELKYLKDETYAADAEDYKDTEDPDNYVDDVELDLDEELNDTYNNNVKVTVHDNFGSSNSNDIQDSNDTEEEEHHDTVDDLLPDYNITSYNDDFTSTDTKAEEIYTPADNEITFENSEQPHSEEDNKSEKSDVDKKIEDEISKNSVSVISKVKIDELINAEKPKIQDFNVDDTDFDDLDEEEDNTKDDEASGLSSEEIQQIAKKSREHLREEILEKIIKAGRKLNTESFAVSNKVVSIKDAVRAGGLIENSRTPQKTYSWPLMYAGRNFSVTPLKGPELAILVEDITGSINIDQMRVIYNHDANPYKPATLESWAKTIPISDISGIFAAVYNASFDGSPYIPAYCPNKACQYSWLTDDVTLEKIAKFDSEESKKKFESIKNKAITADDTVSYESVINVINDHYAVGIKLPSIYNFLYEINALDENFAKKYRSIISLFMFIDYIYLIDPDTREFRPIGWKTYPGDNLKSYKSKISTYSKILKNLNNVDYDILTSLINVAIEKSDKFNDVKFIIPARKCPKCGSDIPEEEVTARELVFTRQQLVSIAITPTEK